MQKITSTADLRKSILVLEIKQANEGQLLKEQFKTTIENLKPVNLIKNTVTELATAPDFKGSLLDTAIGLATGYLSKKIIVGNTHNPIKKLFGVILQIGVTNIVSKNADGVKSTGMHLINNIFRKKDAQT